MARPKKTDITLNDPVPQSIFTGIARTIVCSNNQSFRNFRICTLHIVDGEIKKEELSDHYAAFEAIARLEIEIQKDTIKLNNNWEDGKAWFGSP